MQVDAFEHGGARLAFRFVPGRAPTVVYLAGFRSDMEGRKARRVASACGARGLASLRFDHRGHGGSTGDLVEGSIGIWYRDALALLTARAPGDLVLVGASMGAWLMMLLARAFGRSGARRVRGLIGIGSGADLADRRPPLSRSQRRELCRTGITWRPSRYGDGPYPLTRRMIEDGRRHRILDDRWSPGCPVHLLHGMRDPDVPWRESVAIAETLRGGPSPVRVTLVPDGDHRLSRDSDLGRLEGALDRMVAGPAAAPRGRLA